MIDFDHTEVVPDEITDDEIPEGLDTSGVRWGVRNLIHLFRKALSPCFVLILATILKLSP